MVHIVKAILIVLYALLTKSDTHISLPLAILLHTMTTLADSNAHVLLLNQLKSLQRGISYCIESDSTMQIA